jgi:hypothetical protein
MDALSGSDNAAGDQISRLPSDSRIAAMRVG